MTDSALVFLAGSRTCALPVSHVDEVMRPLPVEQVRSESRLSDGMAIIRGQTVPVVNVEALFEKEPAGRIERFITVRIGSRTVALAVSKVLGVWASHALDLKDVPPLLADAVADIVEAVGRLDGQLLSVLGTGKLVPQELLPGPDVDFPS